MALFDNVFGKNDKESKLREEINSLQLRKESVFSSINNEISRLQSERSNVLLQAGTMAYGSWCKDGSIVSLEEYWNKVQEIEKLITEQETKRTEMGIRYDEEIQLISNNLGVNNAPSTNNAISTSNAITATAGHCPNCNTPFGPDDVFCQNCGTKLQ